MFLSLKSIRIKLLILVFICVLPVLGILIYSAWDREQHEIEEANTTAVNMVQSLSFEYEHSVASTRQFLSTLSKLPDVQNQNAPACNRLFAELLKGNPLYSNIFAATAEGMVFASALPFTPPLNISNRKYFKDVLRTKEFSVGEYLMGVFVARPVLPFAHPVTDSSGRIRAVVVAGITLSQYGQMFPTSKLPKGSVLSLSDHRGVRLYRYPDPEKCAGKADLPEMIRHMSAQAEEGKFTNIGVDGVKRLYAYKRFRLSVNEPPSLYMRVGIPEEEALRDARKMMYVNMSFLGVAFTIAMLFAWFIGNIVIVKRLDKLVVASHKLGQGDLTVRTGLQYREDEMGLLAKTFDEMAEKLESKESRRRLAEEALRQSEEKYHNLADFLPQIVFEADMQGNVTFVNHAAFVTSGYTAEDFDKGLNVLQVIAPEDRDRAGLNMQRILAGSETEKHEYNFLKKDGDTFPVITHTVPIIWNNHAVGMRGLVMDITDRKRAEEMMQTSEKRYRSLASSVDSMFLVDRDCRYMFMNEGYRQRFGMPLEDIIEKRYDDFHTEENSKQFAKIVEEVFETGEPIQAEYQSERDKSYILRTFSPAMDQEGKSITAVTITSKDITDRKQVEDALRESEKRYRFLLDAVPVGIAMTDLEGDVYAVNQRFQEITGYTLEEFKTINIGNIYVDLNVRRKILQALRESGQVRNYEVRWRRKDGTVYFALLNIDQIEHEGRQRLLTAARDITDRKQVEAALQENEALFRKLFEDHAAVKLILDPDTGNIVDANEAAAVFYGWSREQLKQMKIQEINTLPPEEVKKEMEKVRAEQKVQFEFRHKRADGSVRDVQVFSSKIVANKKELLHSIIHDITDRKRAEEELQRTLESLRKAVGTTIQVMVSAVETRDPYTAGHQVRVADLARAIATEMGLPQEKIDGIRMAGSIHDIGKLSIPAEILSKPTKLTEIEFSLIKEHSKKGYEILKDVESPWPLAEMVYQHHERMDGSGYSRNLKGDEIIMEARIMAVADVVEAMASHRPYRPGLGIDAALEEIEKNRRTFYDNSVVDACLRLFREKGYQLEGT